MVRGRGYVHSTADLEKIVLQADPLGTPVLLRDVAEVALGPEIRRGVADLDGRGDAVGGIVVMRHGENARAVIERVQERLREVEPSLPEGVRIVTTYDRSDLIQRAIDTLKHELLLQMVIVSLVILLFLWHIPSAIVPILTIPISVLLAFIPMWLLGISSNIMSLAGIAISIGVLVDGAIVEVENAYKKLELWQEAGRPGDFHQVRLEALMEVGPSVFFSLLMIAVAFLPVFTLVDQEGRLFKPLAWTKNLTMVMAAILALTLDPAMRMLFTRMDWLHFRPRWLSWAVNQVTVGHYYPEEKHPVSRVLFAVYEPGVPLRPALAEGHDRDRLLVMATTVPVYLGLGHEFMPPLNEGTLLYMPTTLPGIRVTEAARLLQVQDRILKAFPEVASVHGKAGRAETSTDPAPFSMMETVVLLQPDSEWRGEAPVVLSWAPEWLKDAVLRRVWRDRITWDELVAEMDAALRIPGTDERLDHAHQGPHRHADHRRAHAGGDQGLRLRPHGDRAGRQPRSRRRPAGARHAQRLRRACGGRLLRGLRPASATRSRATASRVAAVQDVIMSAIGGENVTTTVEGRARFPVNVRYPRDLRERPRDARPRARDDAVRARRSRSPRSPDIRTVTGPSMIRNENGLLVGYVYVDIAGRDVGGYVEDAKRHVAQRVKLPSGYALEWSGQYENMQRVRERLKLVMPFTLFLIFFLLYMNTKLAREDAHRRPRRALSRWSARCGSCGPSATTSRSRSGSA